MTNSKCEKCDGTGVVFVKDGDADVHKEFCKCAAGAKLEGTFDQ